MLGAGTPVAGVSQAEYTVRWWQWANAGHADLKPYDDPTGAQCASFQSGPVWFLAGTDGADRVVRSCRLPAGKFVFFPVIAMIAGPPGDRPYACAEAMATTADNNDHLGRAEVWIDGRAVPDIARHRLRSPACFDQAPADRRPRTRALAFPSATDGYWLMLQPLAPGPHTIRVRASYHNPGELMGDLAQEFEYRLQVDAPVPGVPLARPSGDSSATR